MVGKKTRNDMTQLDGTINKHKEERYKGSIRNFERLETGYMYKTG